MTDDEIAFTAYINEILSENNNLHHLRFALIKKTRGGGFKFEFNKCTRSRDEYNGAHEEENTDKNSILHSETRLPTIADVPRLEYTEKVFRESMRLFPPAWTLGRQAIADYVVDKYVMHRGSIVLMSQYVMHRNPRYFSNPDTFDPDRWTREFKFTLPRFSYFPFGGGIRGCIGEAFAWMEGILVLATICRKWRMHHDITHKVELKPLITLRPKYGMWMKLERRRMAN
jgi:cytochrome P450